MHVAIRESMVAKLRETNPTIHSTRFQSALDVVFADQSEMLKLFQHDFDWRFFVVALGYTFLGRADRSHDRISYSFGVLGVKRAPDALINPGQRRQLERWGDECTTFVKQSIFRPLASTTFAPVAGAFIEPGGAKTDEFIDLSFLRGNGFFWSELNFNYLLDEANH